MKLDFTGKIEQDVSLFEDTQLAGMIVGDVLVNEGVTFTLSGMVIGKITLLKNSRLILPGTLVGRIINKGGSIAKTGMIIESLK